MATCDLHGTIAMDSTILKQLRQMWLALWDLENARAYNAATVRVVTAR
jgi:hypothetical protein